MTSAPLILCDDALRAALAHICGARIDATHIVAETGLVVLALYKERKTLLAIGIGPVAAGVGLLPRLPQGRANIAHPLVAAMRAHLVGTLVRTIHAENNTLWITAEGSNLFSNDGTSIPVRLALTPGIAGSACLVAPTGAVVDWPTNPRPNPGPSTSEYAVAEISLESAGIALLETSDSYRIETFRRELLGVLREKRKRLERRVSAVRQDLARLQDVPQLQKIGSLLLAQGKTIPRGTTQAKLIDWDTNEPILVHLVPDKSAQEQAAQFFQKARRWQRGASIMQQRLDETEKAIDSLLPLQIALEDAAADWDALQEIAQRMQSAGLSVRAPVVVSHAKPRAPDERKPYHTFRSTNEYVIWVGRSSQDNDELVTRFARPHDLWLHAKNIRGAHIIVPLEKNRSCPSDVLVDAATLAAHFSDARNESVCEVSYVERRHVRKLKKSAPGAVSTQREKVIVIRIEKNRLARLLGSKVES
jgi:hypothetical protein